MSSSRKRSKRTSKQPPTFSSDYPSEWSDWVYNGTQGFYQRYRLKAPNKYEYEYSQEPPQSTAGDSQPRSENPLSSIPKTTGDYTLYNSYTASDQSIEPITRDFARSTLGPGFSTPSSATAAPTWQAQPFHITTQDPSRDHEAFDPHYKVHKPAQFRTGRIFKVLWAEPRGSNSYGGGNTIGGSVGTSDSITVRSGQFGESYHEKVRRFVIINPMEGHCICLPILTYLRQGVNKKGVHASHHTIVYSGSNPVYLPGEVESGLMRTPLKVDPASPRHRLDDASRLNYAKTYTVEYNVKVWFIGQVTDSSYWQLATDFNEVHPPLATTSKQPPPTPRNTYSYATGGGSESIYNPSLSSYAENASSYPRPDGTYGGMSSSQWASRSGTYQTYASAPEPTALSGTRRGSYQQEGRLSSPNAGMPKWVPSSDASQVGGLSPTREASFGSNNRQYLEGDRLSPQSGDYGFSRYQPPVDESPSRIFSLQKPGVNEDDLSETQDWRPEHGSVHHIGAVRPGDDSKTSQGAQDYVPNDGAAYANQENNDDPHPRGLHYSEDRERYETQDETSHHKSFAPEHCDSSSDEEQ